MSPKRAGGLFFLFVILHLLMLFLLNGIGRYIPEVYELIPSTLAAQAVILLPTLAFAMMTPAPFSRMFPFRRVKIRSALLTFLMMAGLFPAVGIVNYLTTFFAENVVESSIVTETAAYPMTTMLLLVGVLGPLCEEVVFRGYIYQSLRRSGRVTGSILLSGLLFGLMHMNLNQASYAFLIGIFLAALTRACGSLVLPILAHVSFNSFEVWMMYQTAELLPAETSESAGLFEIEEALSAAGDAQVLLGDNPLLLALPLLLIAGFGILVAFLCLRSIERLEKNPSAKEEAKFTEKPLFGIFTVLGILFSVIFMIWVEGYL
ncbi:MAG: CPBP family intramembrane metalloprotease [Lachnospiraceae bacterium]|nr:CPBP family intramembrane metalloprotease [Lachnospiraceae bacterium]